MSDWLAPDLIASAPGRVNLIGEHVDYNQGFVLPFAIKERTQARIRRRSDQVVRIRSLQRPNEIVTTSIADISPERAGDWERYVLGVIWALGIKEGLDIEIDGRVPLGAGLSSSAALECAVAIGLNELFDLGHSRKDLALLAQRAENDFVGMPCGIMDQAVSMLAESGSALLLDCRDLSTTLVPFDVAASGLELLIIDTQVHHELVDGGYASRRKACESAAKKLGMISLRDVTIEELDRSKEILSAEEFKRAHHVITEIARVKLAISALSSGDFAEFGHLISQTHISLRDDFEVSCAELNCAVDTALANGALGARMVGGGFGGSAIALAPQSQMANIQNEIDKSFIAAGFMAPRFFTSLPSAGASVTE